jgi:hypothetical protein
MRINAREEKSRNGTVMTVDKPVVLTIQNPPERVLVDPIRQPNPYFHVMEFVWMMSGSNDVRWIEQFNSGMRKYADFGTDYIHGAYGYRWRGHFNLDQIDWVIKHLHRDPESRRAVLAMWDADVDTQFHNDVPCNTHIYFRIVDDELNMTVCNRSNDLVWGMLGANAVHMTLLHELIAEALGIHIGSYRVITNNLHVYTDLPNFPEIWGTVSTPDIYSGVNAAEPMYLLQSGEDYAMIVRDARSFVRGDFGELSTDWMKYTAYPMHQAYIARKSRNSSGRAWIECIAAEDWRTACEFWSQWKLQPKPE